jgi:predicted peroxiredoxin
MKHSILLTSLSASLAAADFQIFWTRDYELVWSKDGWEGVRGNCRRTSDQELDACVVKTGVELFYCETDLTISSDFSGN